MIPSTNHRQVVSKGVSSTAEFGISLKDSAHIMTILRDTLYSDKIMAVLREYSSNAWDAHRSIGKHDIPIKITIPTDLDPSLSIRDYGPGLSSDDVFKVYTQYGASTKRDTDDVIGMLGIGSKSGFAYSDSFTITSWNGGAKRTYVAVLDDSEKGVINLLHEEDCGSETGVEIQIAVKSKDIYEFSTKAKNLYKHFKPRPNINIELPPIPPIKTALKNGIIYTEKDYEKNYNEENKWIAVMGCIPYRINLSQLKETNISIPNYINNLSGEVYFEIGEVQINASREELKYNDSTKKALVEKINLTVDECVQYLISETENSGITQWEKRLRYQSLEKLGLPVLQNNKYFPTKSVQLWDDVAPFNFNVTRQSLGKYVNKKDIAVEPSTRLLFRNINRSTVGYHINTYDYIIRPKTQLSIAQAKKELEEIIVKCNIVGIPVIDMSDLPWIKTTYSTSKVRLLKYNKNKIFKLLPDARYHRHLNSDSWEQVNNYFPSSNDVFVLIERFKTDYDFYTLYRNDEDLAELCQITMPTIYGYKSTETKPLKETNIIGIEYRVWRELFRLKAETNTNVNKLRENWEWSCLMRYFNESVEYVEKNITYLSQELGVNHKLFLFINKIFNCYKSIKSISSKEESIVKKLVPIFNEKIKKETEEMEIQYPMLGTKFAGIRSLWTESKILVDYIKMVDILSSLKSV